MIAPFNFPAMVPFWFLPYALATWQYPNMLRFGSRCSRSNAQHSRLSDSLLLSPSEKWNR